MKKLNYLLMGLFVASAFTFTSCSDDEDATGPTMEIFYDIEGANEKPLSAEISAANGDVVNFEIYMTKGSAKLESASYTKKVGATSKDTPIELTDNEEAEALISTTMGAEDQEFTFKVTDKDGLSTSLSVIIKVAKTVQTSSAILMGGQDNGSTGSFYSFAKEKVYLIAEAKTNSANVDIAYYYGATNKATIGAPGDSDTQEIFDPINKDWGTKNATKLKKLTGVTFSDIDTEAKFTSAFSIGTDTKVTTLASGDIIAVETIAGTKAIVQAETITGTATGTIKINIKTVK